MRSFTSGGGAYLTIDASDLQNKLDLLRGILTKAQFERLLHRTFREVGQRSKTIISREVMKDYRAIGAAGWIKRQIGRYNLRYGGGQPVTCTIPISSAKGTVGGRFRARQLQRGRISFDEVRTGRSRLPRVMNNQGGNPPFIAGGSGNGVAYTRRTKDRLPIVRVVGLGVPQMPLNRSSDNVQDSILEVAGNRLEHNFLYMFGS